MELACLGLRDHFRTIIRFKVKGCTNPSILQRIDKAIMEGCLKIFRKILVEPQLIFCWIMTVNAETVHKVVVKDLLFAGLVMKCHFTPVS